MNHRNFEASRMVAALLAIAAAQAWAQEYQISRSTIDGGGVMFSTGDDFELSGTIGQPDAGVMLSPDGVFELTGGFWFEEPPDDCNSDGRVDLIDYEDFDGCLAGPGGESPLPECSCFDLDGDDDVDLSDVATFQSEFMGG